MVVKACLFDIFGTICDWRSGVSAAAQQVFAARGLQVDAEAFALAWRAQYQPGMERVRAGRRPYVALEELHLENLRRVLAEQNLDIPDEDQVRLNAAWSNLPCWQGAPAALAQLRKTHLIAPCSNGSIAMMVGIARRNGMHWDFIGGAPLARDYKPQPTVYTQSVAAFGLAPEEVMMIAAHNDDLYAARAAGLRTGFFPRPTEYGSEQDTDLAAEDAWDIVATDLSELVNQLTG